MDRQKPSRLMRFFGNTDYALQCIEEKKLALVRASKLNDPFDPPIFILVESGKVLANIEELEVSIRGKFYNPYFIASFCEVTPKDHPKNSLYMWAHYGNGHRGVAIEFNFEILEKSLKAFEQQNMQAEEKLFPIQYQHPPAITDDDLEHCAKGDCEALEEKLEKGLSFKTPEWAVEKEWRYMLCNGSASLDVIKDDLVDDAVSAVYIGLRCEKADAIIKQTKNSFPNARVLRAKRAQQELKLEFEEIAP